MIHWYFPPEHQSPLSLIKEEGGPPGMYSQGYVPFAGVDLSGAPTGPSNSTAATKHCTLEMGSTMTPVTAKATISTSTIGIDAGQYRSL